MSFCLSLHDFLLRVGAALSSLLSTVGAVLTVVVVVITVVGVHMIITSGVIVFRWV